MAQGIASALGSEFGAAQERAELRLKLRSRLRGHCFVLADTEEKWDLAARCDLMFQEVRPRHGEVLVHCSLSLSPD